ncbi:MAG: hypothetical protein JWP50_1821 [Phenylobacterium sp.]|nr:hypothetical protein [Phenylobacterium sp.]
MHLSKLTLAAIAALSVNLAPSGAALAQPTDTEALGRQVAHELFTAVNMDDLIRQGFSASNGLDAFSKVRPEWKALLLQAMDEAVARDEPGLEDLLGRSLAKGMTAEELSAGLTVFRDPQARAAIAAASRHEPAPATQTCGAACMRAIGSPAGRGFMVKMQKAFGAEVQTEMIALVAPDVFIRFGEKAKAAEAKRPRP